MLGGRDSKNEGDGVIAEAAPRNGKPFMVFGKASLCFGVTKTRLTAKLALRGGMPVGIRE
jgi:hypothetical protein